MAARHGIQTSEFKGTALAGGLGVIPLLVDFTRESSGLDQPTRIALIAAVAVVAASYNLSRGWAKSRNGGPSQGDSGGS